MGTIVTVTTVVLAAFLLCWWIGFIIDALTRIVSFVGRCIRSVLDMIF